MDVSLSMYPSTGKQIQNGHVVGGSINGVLKSANTAPVGKEKQVRVVKAAEYKAAAHALAEAFADDHVARYFIDTPDRAHWTEAEKWDLHVEIIEYITYAHILKGLVTTVGPDYGCVSLWMPPGKNMDDYLTIARSGMWRLYYRLSTEGKNRFFTEFFTLLHDTKEEVLGPRDQDSYYLVYIGTRPSARGKGYARTCIEHVTSKADKEGRACYLESSNDINPIIYRKLGFKDVKKISLTRAEEPVELDIMVREPVKLTSSEGASSKPSKQELSWDSRVSTAPSQPKVKVQVCATATYNNKSHSFDRSNNEKLQLGTGGTKKAMKLTL